MSVYLLATLDTKGAEAVFVRDRLRELGVAVRLVDTGCLGSPELAADIGREAVFAPWVLPGRSYAHAAIGEPRSRLRLAALQLWSGTRSRRAL